MCRNWMFLANHWQTICGNPVRGEALVDNPDLAFFNILGIAQLNHDVPRNRAIPIFTRNLKLRIRGFERNRGFVK